MSPLHRFSALTRGLVPRLLRLGPGIYNTAPLLAHYYMQTFHSVGGAIMLVVYEQVLHYLEQ